MRLYRYRAIDADGRIQNGRHHALNPADLELRLGRAGLELIRHKPVRPGGRGLFGPRVKRRELAVFCFHLEQSARAGIPLLDSLMDLRGSLANPALAEAVNGLIESIRGGQTLSQAMRQFEAVFGRVFISLIRAGEQSGELAEVLQKLADNLKWQDEQAAHAKKLLLYPAFVGLVVVAVIVFLMTFLVPELLKFVNLMGRELPLHTRLLVLVSNAFAAYWPLILALPALAGALLLLGRRCSAAFARGCDRLKLRLPVIGPILHKIILTRLTGFFALMYASGISIIDCIKTGEAIAGNRAVAGAVNRVGREIANGQTLTDSFAASGLLPPLALRMLRVGENTGALEQALLNISYFYGRDVKESLERLQTIIEPALTVTLGAVIAWVMFSVLGPVYDLIAGIRL